MLGSGGYGSGESRLVLDFAPLEALAADPAALVDRIDLLFFARGMGTTTRDRLRNLVSAMPANDKRQRVKSALLVTAMSPDYVIQK